MEKVQALDSMDNDLDPDPLDVIADDELPEIIPDFFEAAQLSDTLAQLFVTNYNQLRVGKHYVV